MQTKNLIVSKEYVGRSVLQQIDLTGFAAAGQIHPAHIAAPKQLRYLSREYIS